MPEQSKISTIREPFVKTNIFVPNEYVGPVMELCQEKRGIYKAKKTSAEHSLAFLHRFLSHIWHSAALNSSGTGAPAYTNSLCFSSGHLPRFHYMSCRLSNSTGTAKIDTDRQNTVHTVDVFARWWLSRTTSATGSALRSLSLLLPAKWEWSPACLLTTL